ncbi:hypothetical protein [Cellulomonas biazotea]|uniref:Uncharacterized protein n=1 Tax=Cellulomonas biazotea TaxID=1709 RepID=A0A402DVV7_9CELL|nr:hypothetical protein [Cellulomonas biazotea]GCE78216.1 hypothetical protein CBZ_32720 [Cellulomonas biazotea]
METIAEAQQGQRSGSGRVAAVVVTGVGALLLSAYLLFAAVVTVAPFFGEQPTSQDRSESTLLVVLAVAVWVVPVVTAGVLLGRRAAAITVAALLVLGAVLGIVAVALLGA